MKRFLAVSVLWVCLSVLLCSCAVQIGGVGYEVPWWVIGVPTAVIVAIAVYAAAKSVLEKTYVCGECGKLFMPTGPEIGILLHDNDKCVLKCPHCGKRGFCEPTYKNR